MLERYYPDLIVDKVQDIDFEFLKKKGIKGFILDIDNTLVPMYTKQAGENVVKWMEAVKASGLNACIVSNASRTRVVKFNERLGVLAIHRAVKPSPKGFLKAAELMKIKPNEVAVVGDQIFTDIYGGNRVDMFTILVKPLDKREILFVRLKRHIEKFILYKHKIMINNEESINKRLQWKRESAKRHGKAGGYGN